jgi:hypothetical protein
LIIRIRGRFSGQIAKLIADKHLAHPKTRNGRFARFLENRRTLCTMHLIGRQRPGSTRSVPFLSSDLSTLVHCGVSASTGLSTSTTAEIQPHYHWQNLSIHFRRDLLEISGQLRENEAIMLKKLDMFKKPDVEANTWKEDPDDIIVLVNRTANNYILELPAGRYRLDAGRRMRTMRSILDIPQIREMVEEGDLGIE